jgi:hypothetical protein
MSNGDNSHDDERGLSIGEEGPASRSGFDPSPYMRQLRGRGGNQDYLDVKWRLLWLRREHPDAEILTEHVRIDEGMAIFKATVSVPTGGRATGYGSETAGDFGDFIEKAETKAIGRALNALGYGAQFSEKGEDEPAPVPQDRRQASPSAERVTPTPPGQQAEPSTPPVAAVPPQPRPAPAVREVRDAPAAREEPVPIRQAAPPSTERPARGPVAAPRPATPDRPARQPTTAPTPAPSPDDDDVDMADMTWTAFWAWARPLGYNKRGDIEQLLGYSIDTLTPAEVRAQVREARGEG